MYDEFYFETAPIACPHCNFMQKYYLTEDFEKKLHTYFATNLGTLVVEKVFFDESKIMERNEYGFPLFQKVDNRREYSKHTGNVHVYSTCDECLKYRFDVFLNYRNGCLQGITRQITER